MKERWTISIVGPGKVGTALGVLLTRSGWDVIAVGGRDNERTARVAKTISPRTRACSIAEGASLAEVVLLTVSDDAIASVCREFADQGAFPRGSVVVHCSGALSSEVLLPARERCGCAIGSMHPLQTFPTAEAAIERLGGTSCFCEGDDDALMVV